MKKLLIIGLLIFMVFAIFAEEEEIEEDGNKGFKVGAGFVISYDINLDSDLGDFFPLFNFRFGGYIDLNYYFTDWFAIGAEGGMRMMFWNHDSFKLFLFDFPIRIYPRFDVGMIRLQPYFGWNPRAVAAVVGSSRAFVMIPSVLEVGTKIGIKKFYVEGSVLIPASKSSKGTESVTSNFLNSKQFRIGLGMAFTF